MLLENWLPPCVPLQTQPQEKHEALQQMSIPLAPKHSPVFPANPLFSRLVLVLFSGGNG